MLLLFCKEVFRSKSVAVVVSCYGSIDGMKEGFPLYNTILHL